MGRSGFSFSGLIVWCLFPFYLFSFLIISMFHKSLSFYVFSIFVVAAASFPVCGVDSADLGWSEYAPLIPGNSLSHETPVSVAPAASGPIVFAQTPADGLVYYQRIAGQWSKHSLAGRMIGSAGFDVVGDDVYMVHRGMDNATYVKKRVNGSWSADWESLGGLIVASPKIIKTSSGLDIITVGSDNRLWVRHQNNDGVTGEWQMAADVLIKGEIAAARVQDTVVVAIRDNNSVLWLVEKSASGSWGPLQGTGGAALNDPALYSDGNMVYYVHIGLDRALWYKTRVNGVWSGWTTLGGRFEGNVSVSGSGSDVLVSAQDLLGGLQYVLLRTGECNSWQSLDGVTAVDHGLAGLDNEFLFVVRRINTGDLYQISYYPRCTPYEVSGCGVCSADGSAWADDNRLCGAGQTCRNGGCVSLIASFNLSTDDTKITLAVSSGGLFLKELSNPSAGWNWAEDTPELPMMRKAAVDGVVYSPLNWSYDSASLDNSNGTKLTLKYVSDNPRLELWSEWWARPGKGPIRHLDYVVNKANKTVTIYNDPTFDVDLKGFDSGAQKTTLWSFNDDGGTPDPIGIYKNSIECDFSKRLPYSQWQGWAPYIILDKNGSGVYFGSEWSYGAITVCGVNTSNGSVGARVRMEDSSGDIFRTDVFANEIFLFPPGFVGAYNGDADDAGNGLKKYLFDYSMPDVLKRDTSFPKVQWNSIGAIGWEPVESKYYPLVDAVAPLGFEEMMIDIGWWDFPAQVGTPYPPTAHPINWPSGMLNASDYTHNKSMRIGYYDNSAYNYTTAYGISEKKAIIRYLFDEYKADLWRSDCTAGPLIGMAYGRDNRAHYVQDQEYWATKGFYQMLDDLHSEYGNVFQWENCNCAGGLKDFGAMKRATKISNTDTYISLHNRQAFYDASYYLHPMQLHAALGDINFDWYPASLRLNHAEGLLFQFRSASMGSPQIFLDSPNPTEGGKVWTQMEKDQIANAVTTYKTKIRPLIRNGDLYHILPRPNGTDWDGVEYYDPGVGRGVCYLFKPNATASNMKNIRLRGLNPYALYNVTFEDGSNPLRSMYGSELMAGGINVTLNGSIASELMFFSISSSTTTTSSTTSSTTSLPVQCSLNGNYPPCDEVSLQEIINAINAWAIDEFALADVIHLINAWASSG
jgi:hypothetical protein